VFLKLGARPARRLRARKPADPAGRGNKADVRNRFLPASALQEIVLFQPPPERGGADVHFVRDQLAVSVVFFGQFGQPRKFGGRGDGDEADFVILISFLLQQQLGLLGHFRG
jgi:hypothetical protein